MNKPCFVPGKKIEDNRGKFFKQNLDELEINFLMEDYFLTTNSKNVMRGIHWQTSPCATNRIVTLINGEIFDVTVDMRTKSETFGKVQIWPLNSQNLGYLYVPKGFAHGYQVISDFATISYIVDGKYCAEHDSGILWSSIDVDWPISNPIISERDSTFATFTNFLIESYNS